MASIYARGQKLWARIKHADGTWKSEPTPFRVGDEPKAERFVTALQKEHDEIRLSDAPAALTVTAYAERWFLVREQLKVRSWDLERGQLRNHVLPRIGDRLLSAVDKNVIRDLVRDIRKGNLASRTVLEIYGVTARLFASATEDGHIEASPCALKRRGRELPAKRDADPEWRSQATYTEQEVERLFSDPAIPVERRVQYALKALGALRHEEMAALRWRHYDETRAPLGALTIAWAYDSRACEEKETKTGITRQMPVHPALAKILAAWKSSHWPRLYGREPGPDDLICPARTMRNLNVSDAGHAMTEDLEALGLRVEAGAKRRRGGHDLRAWLITTCQTHGAHRDLLKVCTHGPGNNVQDGYTRASWTALSAEVGKLKVDVSDGDVLRLATGFATAERKSGNRWRKRVSPEGLERFSATVWDRESTPSGQNCEPRGAQSDVSRAGGVASLATGPASLLWPVAAALEAISERRCAATWGLGIQLLAQTLRAELVAGQPGRAP